MTTGTMIEVFVGCGSNIEPEQNLRWAVAAMRRRFGEIRLSRVYRSPAFGFDGPDFLNLVAGFSADAPPAAIAAGLSALENERGRREGGRWSSRTLDLDLLLAGAAVNPRLKLPRVDVLRYPFVLAPLAELAPNLAHPVTGERIAVAWSARLAAGSGAGLTAEGEIEAA